jgi:hypothetical protein
MTARLLDALCDDVIVVGGWFICVVSFALSFPPKLTTSNI